MALAPLSRPSTFSEAPMLSEMVSQIEAALGSLIGRNGQQKEGNDLAEAMDEFISDVPQWLSALLAERRELVAAINGIADDCLPVDWERVAYQKAFRLSGIEIESDEAKPAGGEG